MQTKNSHWGERSSSMADKMSGYKNEEIKKTPKSIKKLLKRKNRMFLKNPLFYDKI